MTRQILDSGNRYLYGRQQPCRLLIVWGPDGRIKDIHRKFESEPGVPVIPIPFSDFRAYLQAQRLTQRRRFSDEERKERHREAQRLSRMRLKQGVRIRERKVQEQAQA